MAILKYLRLGLLLAALFFVGIIKDRYRINPFDFRNDQLIKRSQPTEHGYPMTINSLIESLTTNPGWISSTIYSLIYLVLTTASIHYLFKIKKYTKITILVYASLVVLSLLLVLSGSITKNYYWSYGLAQYVKEFIQSPIPLMSLFIVFYLKEKLQQ